jgi:hypothetical protein
VEAGIDLAEVRIERPTLESAYLDRVGARA